MRLLKVRFPSVKTDPRVKLDIQNLPYWKHFFSRSCSYFYILLLKLLQHSLSTQDFYIGAFSNTNILTTKFGENPLVPEARKKSGSASSSKALPDSRSYLVLLWWEKQILDVNKVLEYFMQVMKELTMVKYKINFCWKTVNYFRFICFMFRVI